MNDANEVTRLRELLAAEKQRTASLEEECDGLALLNHQLQQEIQQLRQQLAISPNPQHTSNPATNEEPLDILVEGDGDYVCHERLRIPNATGGMNVLCVCFGRTVQGQEVLICGGGDKRVHIYANSFLVSTLDLPAPVLSVDSKEALLAIACMDGSLAITLLGDPSTLQLHHVHSKYVICTRWSPSGLFLATASYDKTVLLHTVQFPQCTVIKTIALIDTPECIAFATTPQGGEELIIGIRDTAYLIYFPCATETAVWGSSDGNTTENGLNLAGIEGNKEKRVSLNEQEWDTHCSFTPLFLSVSPDQTLLLVSSDKHLHYVYRLRTNQRIATLAGHSCSEYGKPRCAWHSSGKYVYSNSEHDHQLHVYSLASGKIVRSLRGHGGLIKDLAVREDGCVATCSYDKSVIVWVKEVA